MSDTTHYHVDVYAFRATHIYVYAQKETFHKHDLPGSVTRYIVRQL